MSNEFFLAIYGDVGAVDKARISSDLSTIFGAPVQPVDDALGGPSGVLGFIAELLTANLEEVSRQLVGLVRRLVGVRIEIEIGGTKVLVDGASSPDQVMGLLQTALAQRTAPPERAT